MCLQWQSTYGNTWRILNLDKNKIMTQEELKQIIDEAWEQHVYADVEHTRGGSDIPYVGGKDEFVKELLEKLAFFTLTVKQYHYSDTPIVVKDNTVTDSKGSIEFGS
jgi:hypothetical protein